MRKSPFSPPAADKTLYLAAGDTDGRTSVWSLPKGESVYKEPLRSGRLAVHSLAFGPDPVRRAGPEAAKGPPWRLAVGDAGGTVHLWELSFPRVYQPCRGSQFTVHALAFSLDGALLASAGRNEVRLWDPASGRLLLTLGHRNWQTGLAFSLDGRRLAVSSRPVFGSPGGVDLWGLENGRGIDTLYGLGDRVCKVVHSPDGKKVAALSHGWQVGIWDAAERRLLRVLEVHRGWSSDNAGMAFSHDGNAYCFATKDRAELWRLDTGEREREWPLPPGLADAVAFDPKGNRLVLVRVETQEGKRPPFGGGRDQTRVWRFYDLLAKKPGAYATMPFPYHDFMAVAAPDGKYVVLSGKRQDRDDRRSRVSVVDGPSGKELWSQAWQGASAKFCGVYCDPAVLIMALEEDAKDKRTMSVIEIPTKKLLFTLPNFSGALLGPDPEGYRAGEEPRNGVFRGRGLRPILTLPVEFSHLHSVFSPDGGRVTVGQGETVQVIHLEAVRRRLAEVDLGW